MAVLNIDKAQGLDQGRAQPQLAPVQGPLQGLQEPEFVKNIFIIVR